MAEYDRGQRKPESRAIAKNDITSRQLKGFVDNRIKYLQLYAISSRIKHKFNFSCNSSTIQCSPSCNEDGSYSDGDYPGMILKLDSEGEEGRLYTVEGVLNSPGKVYYEDDRYYTEDSTEWYPVFTQDAQEHYLAPRYDKIVEISKIKNITGNPQPWKRERIDKSICGGMLPAISVMDNFDGTYNFQDGRNRIDASLAVGYSKIPIIIINKGMQ